MVKKALSLILFILISLFLIAGAAFGQEVKNGQTTVLPRGEVVNGDYFASGGAINLLGTVNGDAFIMGGSILVDGEVNGDLLVMGGNIDISGKVNGNIRVVGGQVTVSGGVGNNLSVASGNVNITDKATVSGSLAAAAGTLTVLGPIGKGATISGGEATLGNSIGGNVNSIVGQLTLTPEARVNGDLNYTSQDPAQIQLGAVVTGKTTQHFPAAKAKSGVEAFTAAKLALKTISFISYLIVGLLLLRFLPGLMKGKAETLTQKPWLGLLVGFIALVVTPVLIFLLMLTIIGIPVALTLLALYLIALYLSIIIFSLTLGTKIFDIFGQKKSVGWVFVVGLLIYEIVSLIPILGGIITFIAVLLGLGAALLTWKNLYPQLQSKKLV